MGPDSSWAPLGDFLFQVLKAWVEIGDQPDPSESCDARRVGDPHNCREWAPSGNGDKRLGQD